MHHNQSMLVNLPQFSLAAKKEETKSERQMLDLWGRCLVTTTQ